MAKKLTSSAWDDMSDQQKVEWLATFMGYKKPTNPDEVEISDIDTYDFGTRTLWVWKSKSEMIGLRYLDDWNHWRQVEERIMEDENLWRAFLTEKDGFTTEVSEYMRKDLPTKAKDLYVAFQSLSPSEK